MSFFDYNPEPAASSKEILSVTAATRQVKTLIETALAPMWIEGEISNFIHHNSGHMYFSVKDKQAQMSCTMWAGRNSSLRFRPQDGMLVQVYGRVTVYERRGQYQLDVLEMQPAGVGSLQLAFEELKRQLSEEGLFDTEHKKALPPFPERIGIITSATGAAVRDLMSVISRRWPLAELILRPTLVQGEGAAADIVRAIEELNEFGELDLIVAGRGGGSLEDLWAFNEESVARAIFASQLPVVSSVGHEVDYTIADFVADLRAPTPSAAGELVVPEATELQQQVLGLIRHAYLQLSTTLKHKQQRLDALQNSYALGRPADLVKQTRQRLDDLSLRATRALSSQLRLQKERLQALTSYLQAVDHRSILQRGFVLARDTQSGELKKSVSDLKKGEELELYFADGQAISKVSAIKPDTDSNPG